MSCRKNDESLWHCLEHHGARLCIVLRVCALPLRACYADKPTNSLSNEQIKFANCVATFGAEIDSKWNGLNAFTVNGMLFHLIVLYQSNDSVKIVCLSFLVH